MSSGGFSMRQILAATVAMLAIVTAAGAADSVATEAGSATYNWSGFYAGVLLGYGTGDSSAISDNGFDGSAPEDRADLSPKGFAGGAVAGYNWQRDQLVFGVESEVGYLGAKDDFWFPDGDDYFARSEYGLYGSLAGRLGFAIDRTLITARAGVIVADIDYGYGDIDGGVNGEPDPDSSIFGDGARAGFTIGASIEHAFAGDWVGRLDYAYSDFGSHIETDGFDETYDVSDNLHMIRIGLIKKF
ncbi:hypothetical protein AA2016_0042 [Aminobacter aminovorans]|uniref:Outer membrane protein beta-barrel domain-containing protein n=2 Tax=Aminobacter aminovorans TaxID=83263 RepID=A0AAC9FCS6_AMIAI|nr:hypothetical protein AA2016_0042 [Aminobacter aminovorans]